MSEDLGMHIILTAEVADFAAKIDNAKTKLANLAIEAKTLKQGEREIEAALKAAAKAYGEESKEVQRLNQDLVDNKKAQIDVKNETSNLNSELKKSQSTFDRLTKETNENTSALLRNEKQADKTIQSIKNGFTMLKGLVVGYAGKTLLDALIGSNAEFEQYMTSFDVLLGSADKAQKMMEDLEDFSAKTPLQMDDVSKAAQLLLSYGTAQEDVMTRMQQLGDLAQGNAEKLDRVSLAYGQMLAKGKVTGEELRQMTEAGVPLLQALADVMGVTTAELSKMLETGSVGIPELNQAIESMTDEGGKFYNMMEKQAQTMSGMWSTLTDEVNMFARNVGEESFEYLKNELSGLMNTISQMKESGELDEIAANIGESISRTIELIVNLAKFLYEMKDAIAVAAGAFVGLKTAMAISSLISGVVTAINSLVTGLKSVKTASDLARVATEALKTSQLATPWGAIAAAIGLVAGAVVSYNIVAGEATSETDELSRSYEEAKNQIDDTAKSEMAQAEKVEILKDRLYELDDQVRSGMLSDQQAKKAKEEMNGIVQTLNNTIPNLALSIDSETGAWNRQRGEVDSLTNSFIRLTRAKAMATAYQSQIDEAAKTIAKADEIIVGLENDGIDNEYFIEAYRPRSFFEFLKNPLGQQMQMENAREYSEAKSMRSNAEQDMQEAIAKLSEELKIIEEEGNNSQNYTNGYANSGSSYGSASGSDAAFSSSATKESKPVYKEFAYIYPFDEQYPITSGFGDTAGRTVPHDAIDIGAPMGTPVKASNTGTVVVAGWVDGYGNYVEIDHGNGNKTTYGHLSSIAVTAGQTIGRGEKIGEVGSTGNSTGPHLDFRFMQNGVPVNPNGLFTGEYGTVWSTIEGNGSSVWDEYDDYQERMRQEKVSEFKDTNAKKISNYERKMETDLAYGYITEEDYIESLKNIAQAYREFADEVIQADYMTIDEKLELLEEYYTRAEDLELEHYKQRKELEKNELNYGIEQSLKWIDKQNESNSWENGDNEVKALYRIRDRISKFYNDDFYHPSQAQEYVDLIGNIDDRILAAQKKERENIISETKKTIDEVSELKKSAYEKEYAAELEQIEKQFELAENALNQELELTKERYNTRIEYLDRLKQDRDRQKEDEEDNLQLERLQTKLEYEMDEGNRSSLQREINDLNEEIEEKEFDRWIASEKEKAAVAQEIEIEKIEAMIEKEQNRKKTMIDYLADYYTEKMTAANLALESIGFLNVVGLGDLDTLMKMQGLFDTIDHNGVNFEIEELISMIQQVLESYGTSVGTTVINNYKTDNSTTNVSSTYQIKDLSPAQLTKAKQKSLQEYIRSGYVL